MIERFETFVSLISQLQKDIQKLKQIEMQEFGLKGPDVMCLYYLSKYEAGLTHSQLCQLTSVDKAAISRILADLLKKGYIFYPEKKDGKKYNMNAVLTPSGMEIATQLNKIITNMLSVLSEGISEKDRCTMYRSLQKIAENLNQILTSKDVSE